MQLLDKELLEALVPAARLLVHSLGDKCEVAVCDVVDRSFLRILHLENPAPAHAPGDILDAPAAGDLKTGAPIFSEVRHTPEGKITRVSATPLCSDRGELMGAIVITLDITDIVYAQSWLQGLSGYSPRQNAMQCEDVGQMMDLIIDQASLTIGKPVAFMNRSDKKEFIRYLDERGVFQIKKSSEKVAQHLGISKFTLYSCLEEIRAAKEPEHAT